MSYVDTMQLTGTTLLTALESEPDSAIAAFVQHACGPLPRASALALRQWYAQRRARACGTPMLGEHAVRIFTDLLNCSPETAQAAEKPWQLLYLHALLLDDVLDLPSPQSATLEELCAMFKQEHEKAAELVLQQHYTTYLPAYQRYQAEAWQAITFEMEWSHNTRTITDADAPRQQGLKAALAKACAAMLLLLEHGMPLTDTQEEGIITLCEGIQLLDDLADMVEDHTQGRMNRLLNTTYRWLRQQNPAQEVSELGQYQLFVAAVLSSAISCTWVDSANRYERTLQVLGSSRESGTAGYFQQQARQCRRSSARLTDVLAQYHNQLSQLQQALYEGEERLAHALTAGSLVDLWRNLRAIVGTGPKASN